MHSLVKNNFLLKFIALFLFFTAIHYAMGYHFKIFYILAITGILIVVNDYPKVYKTIIAIYTLVGIFYLPVGLLYGYPDYNIFSSFYYTDSEEAKGFLKNINYKYYLLSILLLCFSYFIFKLKFEVNKKSKYIFSAIFLIITAISPIKALSEGSWRLLLTSGLPECRFFTESLFYLNYLQQEKKSIEGDDTFETVTSNPKYHVYVIVIGESVRRDFMHSYGFPIENTPFTDTVKGYIFDNYISASGSTNLSLSNTLSLYPKMQNNIISLANKAEFKTFWISRQGTYGKHDGPVASIAKRATHAYFVGGSALLDNNVMSQDAPVIPKFIESLEQPGQHKLIVVHLIGSHSPFCDRIDNTYEQFHISDRLSCYIQSIKNTDVLLSQIQQLLIKQNTSWSMLYFSDHGLSFIDNQTDLIHGDKTRQNYEVPFFITSSDSTQREVISARRSAMSFMTLFSQWTGISEKRISQSCSMISNQECENQNTVINFDKNSMSFERLNNDEKK
ncbi:phosphoethanolamine transferase [Providencia sp. JUb39]|uniref:phosphoethanolamine transferase n=1 Tax=Providencia sp. JUb39 TaxID=2724165 RepID=UPI00164E5837|nr:phosphoethanolamine transferase [Providencia sp. JUb39]MBC5790925.1 phosphoethanolamine transferase [Providencia sp. JUb39]